MARILVVEDDLLVALGLRRALEKFGYELVNSVQTGEAAVRTAAVARPDLVLMDVHLEGEMDGIEAASRIRRELGVPVVFLTAYSDEETVARARASEPYGFLTKPIDDRELRPAIEVALGRHAAERERRRAEDARLYLASIVESSEDAIIGKRLDGVITAWNRGAERMFGYVAAEAVGTRLDALYPAGYEAEEAEIIARVARGEKIEHFEARRRARDGRVLDVSMTISPIRDASGAVVGVSKILRDMTDRKLAESQRLAVAELESLRRQDRFLTQFVNTAAHELATPLTPIRLQLDLLAKKRELPPDVQSSLAVLRRNVDRLEVLVREILDTARMRGGTLKVARERVDLAELVHGAIVAYRESARRSGQSIEERLAPGLAVEGDRLRLAQVVDNLLSNAVKFTPSGGRIVVETLAADGGAAVRVTDTGVGISADDLAGLFQPFRRAADPEVAGRPGTGLGLHISKGIVELHGGRIVAESGGRGKGTTVTFVLPLAS